MPTYQYACAKCGREFELFQSMKDAALEICPKDKCEQPRWGKGKVQRQLGTGAGLIFKGSGFYITDYRSENYKSAARQEAGAASPKKTDSTPATPAPTSAPATPAAKPSPSTSS
jgi:putative FmdB family regulatory protein